MVLDGALTFLFTAGAIITAFASIILSWFFVMATDGCGLSDSCPRGRLDLAYLVTWGGIGLAIVTMAAGMIISARRQWIFAVWPLVSILIIAGTWYAGATIAESIMR